MCLKAIRSVALKSHVLLAIFWHSIVGYVVGKRMGQEPLLAYLRDVYAPHIERILRWHGIPITIEGDTSPLQGGALVLSPHESMLDCILGHLSQLGGRPAYVAKAGLFRIPLFGACMRMAGMIPITEGNLHAVLKAVKQKLREGRTVVVFPQGGRTIPPHTLPAERERPFIRLAKKCNVPVVRIDFGRWYEVWGPPRTLCTAKPGPITIRIDKHLVVSDIFV